MIWESHKDDFPKSQWILNYTGNVLHKNSVLNAKYNKEHQDPWNSEHLTETLSFKNKQIHKVL